MEKNEGRPVVLAIVLILLFNSATWSRYSFVFFFLCFRLGTKRMNVFTIVEIMRQSGLVTLDEAG